MVASLAGDEGVRLMAKPPKPPISVTELGRKRLIRALELAYIDGRDDKEKSRRVPPHDVAVGLADQLLRGHIRAEGEES